MIFIWSYQKNTHNFFLCSRCYWQVHVCFFTKYVSNKESSVFWVNSQLTKDPNNCCSITKVRCQNIDDSLVQLLHVSHQYQVLLAWLPTHSTTFTAFFIVAIGVIPEYSSQKVEFELITIFSLFWSWSLFTYLLSS